MIDMLLIVISFLAGAAVAVLAMHGFGKRLLRVAKLVNEAQNALRADSASPASSAVNVPVFNIPLSLDKDRVVEAGYAQAVREEAQRIGRLN